MNNKIKDLIIITAIYVLAFVIGFTSSISFSDLMLKVFIFDVVATIVTFIFSVIFHNSSVYDAYWSLTPMVIIIWMYYDKRVTGTMQMVFI